MKNRILLMISLLLLSNLQSCAETYHCKYNNQDIEVKTAKMANGYVEIQACTPKINCKSKVVPPLTAQQVVKNLPYSLKQLNIIPSLSINDIFDLATESVLKQQINTLPKKPKIPYHDSDDKSAFWIPEGLEPLMMSNQQLEKYRIIDNVELERNYNLNSHFIKHAIEIAKIENRPLIKKDIEKAQDDYQKLHLIEIALDEMDTNIKYNANNEIISIPKLSFAGEEALNKLISEYGEDIIGAKYKKKLDLINQRKDYLQTKGIILNPIEEIYKQRQYYIKKNNIKNFKEITKQDISLNKIKYPLIYQSVAEYKNSEEDYLYTYCTTQEEYYNRKCINIISKDLSKKIPPSENSIELYNWFSVTNNLNNLQRSTIFAYALLKSGISKYIIIPIDNSILDTAIYNTKYYVDSIGGQCGNYNISSTFLLGYIAEKKKDLIIKMSKENERILVTINSELTGRIDFNFQDSNLQEMIKLIISVQKNKKEIIKNAKIIKSLSNEEKTLYIQNKIFN